MTTKALMNTYGPRSTTLVRGEGCWLWDDKGNKYLDALSGIAVCGLGHSHPAVAKAIAEQAATLTHCSNYFNIPLQEQLADALRSASGMTNMFFGNSGAEANEAAIKLARMYGHKRGIKLPTVVVMEKSFHGRTLATLSASGNRKIQAGFEPLVRGFVRAPFDDLAALEKIAENNSDVCAILVEPIQGEGGIRVPAPDYLNRLRAFCDKHQWLLMLDEVQTGNGRTGTYFNFQQYNITPDVVTTAKGLGNGLPIGVCLAHGVAAELMQPGNHGSTFGGNLLACAGALATVETIENQQLSLKAAKIGDRLLAGFKERLAGVKTVKDVRGRGLMIGIQMTMPCKSLFAQALDAGLVINVTADSVIRLLPPLIFDEAHADQLMDVLVPLIVNFKGD